jgi:hypothetical protein
VLGVGYALLGIASISDGHRRQYAVKGSGAAVWWATVAS